MDLREKTLVGASATTLGLAALTALNGLCVYLNGTMYCLW